MRNVLSELDAKVTVLCQCLPTTPEINTAVPELLSEIGRQQNELANVLNGALSEEALEKFTREYHLGLIRMLSELYQITGKEPGKTKRRFDLKNASKTESIEKVYEGLHQLWNFLNCHFDKYIPKEKPIPSYCYKPLMKEIKESQRYITKRLKNLDQELFEIVIEPFVHFAKYPLKQTWHNFYYCTFLANEFKVLADCSNEITTADLIQFLIFINYNSIEFFNYYVERLREKGSNLEELYLLKKELALAPVKPKVAYDNERKGLADHLKIYVNEEIDYLEHTGKKVMDDPARKSGVTLVPNRLVWNLSQQRLAFKHKVYAHLELIEKGKHEDLYKVVANNSSTIGAKYPSPKTFKNDYLKPTLQTMEAELAYHLEAIKYIESEILSAGNQEVASF
ncbi:hypothetical protein [Desertivirga brevis]|uniref:hypothetical protein n=1 Tax=Desertivirga brevis TaxID=2810310 RepID=UPI001A96C814|nr:hypothetical protein [Pedobacter sp. SYSU D00873]